MAEGCAFNMKAIKLNHALTVRQNSPIAMILLLVGSLIFCAGFLYIQYLSKQTQRLEADIEKLSHPKLVKPLFKLNSKEYLKAREESVAINSVVSEITLPWTALFKTLEAVDRPEIKLMSVEPNTKKQSLRINAVAMDTENMMSYIDDLSTQKMLKSVALVTQQNADINGQPALHFVVEALW